MSAREKRRVINATNKLITLYAQKALRELPSTRRKEAEGPALVPKESPEQPGLEPTSRWNEVRSDLDAGLLGALNKVWFDKGKLTRGEERQLREVHATHPLGQSNFNTWVKQTLRQAHEGATITVAA